MWSRRFIFWKTVEGLECKYPWSWTMLLVKKVSLSVMLAQGELLKGKLLIIVFWRLKWVWAQAQLCTFFLKSVFFKKKPLKCIKHLTQSRGEVNTSCCHGSKICGSQQTMVLQIWQIKKNWHIMTFLCVITLRNKTVLDYFSFFVWQRKWPSPSRNIVEIQRFCYHDNVMLLCSSLYNSIL